MRLRRRQFGVLIATWATTMVAWGQIDPYCRDLVQLGFNQALEGAAPLAAYAYYYLNRPEFLQSNLALRLSISPVYLDGELGIRNVVTPHTELGIGLAGGGFAFGYDEIRGGKWYREESFDGHGAGTAVSVYQLLNPAAKVPLYAIVRGGFLHSFYERRSRTLDAFTLPDGQPMPTVRAGLRLGGAEPGLEPDLMMEISAWYEGQFRLQPGEYGFDGDRRLESASHLFWARAAAVYTLPESRDRFELAINAGTAIHPDRFSAYRLGGMLPLAAEFPFAIPGYYYNELSARNFMLVGGSVQIPLDPPKRWSLGVGGVTGLMAYTPGLEQPGNWHTGVGGSITYFPPSKAFKLVIAYGYGIDAIRTHGRGANSVAILLQIDLAKNRPGEPMQGPERSPFIQRVRRFF